MPGVIVPLVNALVSCSTAIAIEGATKLLTPFNVKAVTGFGIRMGTMLVGAVIAERAASFVVSHTEKVLTALNEEAAASELTVKPDGN